jgi:hypothetical protein
MYPVYVRTLVSAIALIGMNVAFAQLPRAEDPAGYASGRALDVVRVASTASISPNMAGGSTHRDFGRLDDGARAQGLVASAALASDAPRGHALASNDSGLKEWMLVLIGVFLIGTISQRRVGSLGD